MFNIIQEAQITGIKAQGEAHIKAIQSSTASSESKAIAIAESVVNTQIAIIKVMSGDNNE
ncbi:hypothetical protein N9924_01320 [bacterium]|nr:hypothetical protein [bacterium]